jgi:Ser/Thr protein kinase RdoA (MazF antagonist)
MLGAPDVDPVVLTAALIREFGLSDSTLRSIAAGETSWCFEATDRRGGRWFVKLTPEDAIDAVRAELALRLGRALADLGLSVPRPMLTRSGALRSRLEGLRLAVFEFVDGEPLGDRELSAAGTVDLVARLVAAIHAATPALAMPVPAETFTVWADGLGRRLAELGFTVADSGIPAEARALVWPQRTALLSMVERLGALGKAARSRVGDQVLCHGDLIGDNLLRDRAGRLWAVDWDGAVRAPRELDLALFAGRGFQRFLESYRVAVGDEELVVDPDLIGFFLLRRNLDDLVDWLGGALDEQRPEAQRRADLEGVRWCLSRWGALQARISEVRSVLDRQQPPRQP